MWKQTTTDHFYLKFPTGDIYDIIEHDRGEGINLLATLLKKRKIKQIICILGWNSYKHACYPFILERFTNIL